MRRTPWRGNLGAVLAVMVLLGCSAERGGDTTAAIPDSTTSAVNTAEPSSTPAPGPTKSERGPGVLPGDLAQVTGRVAVGDEPCGVVGGGGRVWVSVFNAAALFWVDPQTMALSEPIPVGTNPCGLAVGGGSVWVENYGSDDVTRVDLSSGAVIATIPVGSKPYDVTYAAGAAWVTNYGDGTVTRIDGATQKRTLITVEANPIGIVAAGGTIWVAHQYGDLVGIDPKKRAVTVRTSIGEQANWTAARGSDLWVGGRQTNQVVRVDARTGKVVARYDVGALPLDGDVVDGVAWFPDKEGKIHELPEDPEAPGRVLDSGVGWPFVIAGFDGLIWAADYTGTDLVRIDPSLS